jgi:HEAT repeat protein
MPFGLDDMRNPSMHRTVTGSRDLPEEFLPWVQRMGIWLDDPDATQRQLAAHSIGTVRDFTAIASLVLATWDSDPAVAGEAITALGLIGPLAREAIPTLEILTEHEDRQIVERAKAALKQITENR